MGNPASFGPAVYIGRSRLDRPVGVFGQRNRVRVRLAAASIEVGTRALIGFVKQSRAWFAARQARNGFVIRSGARLTGRLCRLGLRRWGRTRTVVICGVTSNNRWSGP